MRIVTVEDAVLARLAANPANVLKFPFLRAAARQPRGRCGGCGRADLTPIKMAIAGLPADKLVTFKALLGADKLRVIYVAGGKTRNALL